MKNKPKFLLRLFSVSSALLSALLLVVGGLFAESRAPAGGFLYSDYLTASAASAGVVGVAGSFVVETSRPFAGFRTKTTQLLRQQAESFSAAEVLDGLVTKADLSTRWKERGEKTGWGIVDIAVQEAFFQATEGARLSGLVRIAELDWQTELGGRQPNIGVNFLGALQESNDDAIAWQLRAFKGRSERAGANAGLIYRRVVGETLVGVNAFWDYESKDVGNFWRGSLGAEVRSAWVDLYGNYYSGITDEARRGMTVSYTADGYDLEVNVHSPKVRWFTAAAAYYNFKGEFGDSNDSGVRFGVKVDPPNSGMAFELYRDSSKVGNNFGGKLSWTHRFGKAYSASSGGVRFNPRDYFFASATREYTQRIRTRTSAIVANVVFSFSAAGGIQIARKTGAPISYTAADSPITLADVSASAPFDMVTSLNGDLVTVTYETSAGDAGAVAIGSSISFDGMSMALGYGRVSLSVTTGDLFLMVAEVATISVATGSRMSVGYGSATDLPTESAPQPVMLLLNNGDAHVNLANGAVLRVTTDGTGLEIMATDMISVGVTAGQAVLHLGNDEISLVAQPPDSVSPDGVPATFILPVKQYRHSIAGLTFTPDASFATGASKNVSVQAFTRTFVFRNTYPHEDELQNALTNESIDGVAGTFGGVAGLVFSAYLVAADEGDSGILDSAISADGEVTLTAPLDSTENRLAYLAEGSDFFSAVFLEIAFDFLPPTPISGEISSRYRSANSGDTADNPLRVPLSALTSGDAFVSANLSAADQPYTVVNNATTNDDNNALLITAAGAGNRLINISGAAGYTAGGYTLSVEFSGAGNAEGTVSIFIEVYTPNALAANVIRSDLVDSTSTGAAGTPLALLLTNASPSDVLATLGFSGGVTPYTISIDSNESPGSGTNADLRIEEIADGSGNVMSVRLILGATVERGGYTIGVQVRDSEGSEHIETVHATVSTEVLAGEVVSNLGGIGTSSAPLTAHVSEAGANISLAMVAGAGGDGNYTYAPVGTPSALAVNSSGVISFSSSGGVVADQTFIITVQVSDNVGTTPVSVTVHIYATDALLGRLESTLDGSGTSSDPFTVQFSDASVGVSLAAVAGLGGDGSYTYAPVDTPTALTVNGSNGIISFPSANTTVNQTFDITVEVSSTGVNPASVTVYIYVQSEPLISRLTSPFQISGSGNTPENPLRVPLSAITSTADFATLRLAAENKPYTVVSRQHFNDNDYTLALSTTPSAFGGGGTNPPGVVRIAGKPDFVMIGGYTLSLEIAGDNGVFGTVQIFIESFEPEPVTAVLVPSALVADPSSTGASHSPLGRLLIDAQPNDVLATVVFSGGTQLYTFDVAIDQGPGSATLIAEPINVNSAGKAISVRIRLGSQVVYGEYLIGVRARDAAWTPTNDTDYTHRINVNVFTDPLSGILTSSLDGLGTEANPFTVLVANAAAGVAFVTVVGEGGDGNYSYKRAFETNTTLSVSNGGVISFAQSLTGLSGSNIFNTTVDLRDSVGTDLALVPVYILVSVVPVPLVGGITVTQGVVFHSRWSVIPLTVNLDTIYFSGVGNTYAEKGGGFALDVSADGQLTMINPVIGALQANTDYGFTVEVTDSSGTTTDHVYIVRTGLAETDPAKSCPLVYTVPTGVYGGAGLATDVPAFAGLNLALPDLLVHFREESAEHSQYGRWNLYREEDGEASFNPGDFTKADGTGTALGIHGSVELTATGPAILPTFAGVRELNKGDIVALSEPFENVSEFNLDNANVYRVYRNGDPGPGSHEATVWFLAAGDRTSARNNACTLAANEFYITNDGDYTTDLSAAGSFHPSPLNPGL